MWTVYDGDGMNDYPINAPWRGIDIDVVDQFPHRLHKRSQVWNLHRSRRWGGVEEMLVLGIETSCDETGVALYDTDAGLVAESLYSQVELHARYGGVVPELASRDHIRKISPLLSQLLDNAGRTPADLDGVAFTAGPGLMGALLVGATVGRSLAYGLGIPAIGVHHMEAHLLAPLIGVDDLSPPFAALLVSGGHTQIVRVDDVGRYTMLGESLDDAAGEAFDKAAKMLGLGYPGGPAIAKAAEQGDPHRFSFPAPDDGPARPRYELLRPQNLYAQYGARAFTLE